MTMRPILLGMFFAAATFASGVSPLSSEACGATSPTCIVPTTLTAFVHRNVQLSVESTVALEALDSTFAPVVTRLDYAPGYGAPPLLFASSDARCSLNGGRGDGGSQVRSADDKCWLARFPAGAPDVREWGAQTDGVTDATPAISACQAVRIVCSIPASAQGVYIGTPLVSPNGRGLQGQVFSGGSSSASTKLFPGQSQVVCGTSPCVTLGDGASAGAASSLRDLVITRLGIPASGDIGLLVNGGFNVNLQNVAVFNHDTCIKFRASGTAGIAALAFGLYPALCKSHYYVFDGWPEAKIIGGRAGINGVGDYDKALDFVYQTRTTALGAGGGPNGITFIGYQFNPGGGGVACAFRWGGFTGTGGLALETRLNDVHIEWHTYTGLPEGIFCSDSTVPIIQQLFVTNMVTATSGVSAPLFALDPATALSQSTISNNIFGCTDITLAPRPASGPAFSNVYFSQNFGCFSASFTSNGVGNNTLALVANNWGGSLGVGGEWFNFTSLNDRYSRTKLETATGHIAMSNSFSSSWTPRLTFGGESAGITYRSSSGSIQRTINGGFTASFSISLSNKGGATGEAQIVGIPLGCGSIQSAALPSIAKNFSILTGSPLISIIGGDGTALSLSQPSASGYSSLTDTNFTNSTAIAGTVTCGLAK